ncbi:RadR transcriptional regulator [Pyrenophora tritici-repentis]|nr:RadR transcriptional regulator [Pyrenophora tritici-repentis]KAI2482140.1 RadR transcriptional regulator [Pyrenophora tritici-repentis]
MEEDWTRMTDPKEKKRIQNRVAQRVHREKLRSRIRQLEEQLESVAGALTQNDTSKLLSSYDDPTSSFAIPEVSPTTNFDSISDIFGTNSSDITFIGNHATKSLRVSQTAVESGFNTIPQTSIAAQLDSLSQNSAEVPSMDLEWLLKESGALKTALERTQVHSPPVERGHKSQDHSQSPSITSLPQHLGSSDHVWVGGNSGQSVHKMTTVPIAQITGHETLLRPDVTRLERLSLLVEYSRRLGFSNLDEALSVYYTSDLSTSAILSHEQSLNRVRQLPNFLSNIREHSKHWTTWERANYVRETLRSAEDIYAEECKLARINLRDQGVIDMKQNEFKVDQMFQVTRGLQQEIPNTWALITSIVLHTDVPGEPQRPQTILIVMMLLCYRSQDPITTLGLCQEYLYQQDGTNDNGFDLLHSTAS